ncbi:MAG: hypothetical protein RPS47_13825 [Colwellia sp.]|jgi:hypothetical protein
MNNLLQIQVKNLLKFSPNLSEIQAMNICLTCNLKAFKNDFAKRTNTYNQSKLTA